MIVPILRAVSQVLQLRVPLLAVDWGPPSLQKQGRHRLIWTLGRETTTGGVQESREHRAILHRQVPVTAEVRCKASEQGLTDADYLFAEGVLRHLIVAVEAETGSNYRLDEVEWGADKAASQSCLVLRAQLVITVPLTDDPTPLVDYTGDVIPG